MKDASPHLRRAALIIAACFLTQCAMPPRDAWRIVRNDGLFPYLMGTYTYQPGPAQNRYMASSSAPLQHSVQPTPRMATVPAVPYRDDYVPNRYLAGSYYSPESSPRPQRTSPEPAPSPAKEKPKQKAPSTTASRNSEAEKLDTLLTPKEKKNDAPASLSVEELPYGTPVSGRPGMVNSPFATRDQLVDVTGMSVGETVKCPYSGKLFRVPPTQAASSTPKSSSPSVQEPTEEPKSSTPAPEPETTPNPDKPADDAAAKKSE